MAKSGRAIRTISKSNWVNTFLFGKKKRRTLGRKWLVANLSNWTSENVEIDKFIQEHQRTKNQHMFFVWIDPSRLMDIQHVADGGFASVRTYIAPRGWIAKGTARAGETNLTL